MNLSSTAKQWGIATLLCWTLVPSPTAAQGARAFGLGAPNTIEELPTGAFRSALEGLPGQARGRALGILRRHEFTEGDLPFLRVDPAGGVFYEDPAFGEAGEAAESGPALEEITFADAFSLHSKPGASRTVYLDMDGHVVSGTIWNGSADPLYMRPYDTDGNDGVFSQSELDVIAEVWKRVAEDFASYDIDVTTEEPTSFGPDVGHILVTRKADQYGNPIYSCNCGGVAYVGVWGRSNYTYYQPALVFLDGVGGPHNIAEAASHELGHNLNLSHDGAQGTSYYSGHGSGYTDWGPIMGVGYSAQVTQWSQGEYAGATNTQDDLDIIRGYLGYRVDDHEDVDFGYATPLTISNGTDVFSTNPITDPSNLDPANKGIIEDRSDVDLFYFDSGPGSVDLTVTPAWIAVFASHSRRGMNVDIEATLYDELGGFVAQSNPTDDTYAHIVTSVSGGRYVLAIDGVGFGDPNTGYSDYGSIGQYFINGNVPEDTVSTLPPVAPSDLQASLSGDVDILLIWTDPASTPESDEAAYRVLRQVDGGPFVQVAELPSGSQGYADNNLPAGLYSHQVEAYNAVGSASNITSAIEIDVPSVAHATGETLIDGEIQLGSYLDTAPGGSYERLAERHQGGRPSQRVSKLEQVWTVSGVAPGAGITLEIDAEAPNPISGDSFEFSYAASGGPYTVFDVLDSGQGRRTLSGALAAGTSGTVTVRVRDTNRAPGDRDQDVLDVRPRRPSDRGQFVGRRRRPGADRGDLRARRRLLRPRGHGDRLHGQRGRRGGRRPVGRDRLELRPRWQHRQWPQHLGRHAERRVAHDHGPGGGFGREPGQRQHRGRDPRALRQQRAHGRLHAHGLRADCELHGRVVGQRRLGGGVVVGLRGWGLVLRPASGPHLLGSRLLRGHPHRHRRRRGQQPAADAERDGERSRLGSVAPGHCAQRDGAERDGHGHGLGLGLHVGRHADVRERRWSRAGRFEHRRDAEQHHRERDGQAWGAESPAALGRGRDQPRRQRRHAGGRVHRRSLGGQVGLRLVASAHLERSSWAQPSSKRSVGQARKLNTQA
jgi:hypothetical protein